MPSDKKKRCLYQKSATANICAVRKDQSCDESLRKGRYASFLRPVSRALFIWFCVNRAYYDAHAMRFTAVVIEKLIIIKPSRFSFTFVLNNNICRIRSNGPMVNIIVSAYICQYDQKAIHHIRIFKIIYISSKNKLPNIQYCDIL